MFKGTEEGLASPVHGNLIPQNPGGPRGSNWTVTELRDQRPGSSPPLRSRVRWTSPPGSGRAELSGDELISGAMVPPPCPTSTS